MVPRYPLWPPSLTCILLVNRGLRINYKICGTDQLALDAARPGWAESPTLADDVLTYFRLFTGRGCAVAGRLCATAARLSSSKTWSTSDFIRSGSGIRLGSAI